MTPSGSPSESWIVATVRDLNDNGSWTGRIHVHKLLFVVKVLKVAEPPFEFEPYDYGPYSFTLDANIADLELSGYLERTYPNPGYGPKYTPTSDGNRLAGKLDEPDARAIGRVASVLGPRTSKQLELLATCLWCEHQEAITRDEDIISRVVGLKPQYSPGDVETALQDARQIVRELASANEA